MKVESVSEFIKEIIDKTQKLSGVNESEIFWFRAEASENYKTPLVPTSYRILAENINKTNDDLFDSKDIKNIESNIHASFIRKAMPYIISSGIENTSWNRYFLMQHYNINTRLLDWTENALLALFFAISDTNQIDNNGIVWILRPYRLNTFSVRKLLNNDNDYNFIPYGYDKETANDLCNENGELNISELTSRYFQMDFKQTTNDSGIYNPLAIYPTYLDRRMQAQKSCFTIFGNKVNGLLSNTIDNTMFLDKIIIPHEFKYHMLNELRILGIDTTSIYPDLDGLGKSISSQFESSFRDNTETLEHVLLKTGTIKPAGNNL